MSAGDKCPACAAPMIPHTIQRTMWKCRDCECRWTDSDRPIEEGSGDLAQEIRRKLSAFWKTLP